MRNCIIAATLMLTTSAPVLADSLNSLRDALDHLPATLMVEQRGDLAYFLDVPAIRSLGDSADRPFLRAMPTADIPAFESLSRTEPAEWESKAGITLDSLRYFTGYGVPPNVQSHWGLADAAAATDMIAALEGMGFENAGVPDVVGNGMAHQMDPSRRDPSDPWRTRIGAAQFAAANGTNVVQAQTPQAAMLATAQQPLLGDSPVFQTALGGLEQAIGDGQIVQALMISPIFGMAGLDPALLLTPSPNIDETRQRLEEQMAKLSTGIPPYLGGVIADVQHEKPGVAIALAYPDCTIAQTAADAIAIRWGEMAGDTAQGDIATETADDESGLCAALFSVSIDADSAGINPAYRAIIEPYLRRQAGVLQIGQD
jgi:hypothetical protein